MWTRAFADIPIHPDCLAAVRWAADLLSALGHEVEDVSPPPIDFDKFVKAQIEVMAANVTVTVNGRLRSAPDGDWRDKLEPAILDAYEIGTALSAERYVLAITRFHTIGRQMEAALTDHDFALSPTLMQPPAPLGTLSTQDDFRSFRTKASRYTTFLAVVNASGQPAASLPLHWSADGLPIGVQLIGHFGSEAELLRLSARLEEAAPWFHRRPPL